MSISLGVKLKNTRFSCLLFAGVLMASLFVSIAAPILSGNIPVVHAAPDDQVAAGARFTVNGSNLALANTDNATKSVVGSTFSRVGASGEGDTFFWKSNQNFMFNQVDTRCPLSIVQYFPTQKRAVIYLIRTGHQTNYNTSANDHLPGLGIDVGCQVDTSHLDGINVGVTVQAQPPADPNNPNPGGGTGDNNNGENETAKPNCEREGGVLGFILCFIVEGLLDALGKIHSTAVNYLHFTLMKPDAKQGLDAEAYKRAKASHDFLTRLALIVAIIAFIVMIMGTAVGSLLDAYTIKKILPRLVIAVLFISLSWYVTTFAIEIGNVLGAGIRDIILSPFPDSPMIKLATPGGVTGAGVDLLASIGVTGGFAALFLVPGLGQFILLTLLSVVMPIVITILLGFLIIVARRALLLLFVIVSPLAIALWILPGTESLFRRWMRIFSLLIFMYPIFQATLAIGMVMAIITTGKT